MPVAALIPIAASVLGGLLSKGGGGSGGGGSASSSSASNTLNVTFNPAVFASSGYGSPSVSPAGDASGSSSASSQADATGGVGGGLPSWFPTQTQSYPARYDVGSVPASTGLGGDQSMILVIMLAGAALFLLMPSGGSKK